MRWGWEAQQEAWSAGDPAGYCVPYNIFPVSVVTFHEGLRPSASGRRSRQPFSLVAHVLGVPWSSYSLILLAL